jgi:hypothetical protein
MSATPAVDRFERVPLFSVAACDELAHRVDGLRDEWERCHPSLPYFVLGTSSFVSARHDREGYERRAAVTNERLRSTFADLHDHVRAAVEDIVGRAVTDHAHAALPGFHIFGFHPVFRLPIAGAHFDRLYRYLRWPSPVDEATSMSFTLPLVLPEAGGGIDWWPLDPGHVDPLDAEAAGELVERVEPHHVDHACGTLVVHSGVLLHRIAATPRVTLGDRRITLQGHVISSGPATWWYW